MATTKSFKLSQLPEISQSTISNDDLLLVSDYNGGKCQSKKMTIKEHTSYISKKLQPQIQNVVQHAVEQAITEALQQQVAQIASQVLQDELPEALSAALEGEDFDNLVRNSLDRISDGKVDETILVNGGDSASGGEVYDN